MDLDKIDSNKLAQLVEKRPIIWNKDKYPILHKDLAWQEVFREMIDNYDAMNEEEKINHGKAIKQKWTNTRNSFVAALKSRLSSSETHRYQRCKFLLPIYTKEETQATTTHIPKQPHQSPSGIFGNLNKSASAKGCEAYALPNTSLQPNNSSRADVAAENTTRPDQQMKTENEETSSMTSNKRKSECTQQNEAKQFKKETSVKPEIESCNPNISLQVQDEVQPSTSAGFNNVRPFSEIERDSPVQEVKPITIRPIRPEQQPPGIGEEHAQDHGNENKLTDNKTSDIIELRNMCILKMIQDEIEDLDGRQQCEFASGLFELVKNIKYPNKQ